MEFPSAWGGCVHMGQILNVLASQRNLFSMKYFHCRGFLNFEIIVSVGSPYGSQVVLSLNCIVVSGKPPRLPVVFVITSAQQRETLSSGLWTNNPLGLVSAEGPGAAAGPAPGTPGCAAPLCSLFKMGFRMPTF